MSANGMTVKQWNAQHFDECLTKYEQALKTGSPYEIIYAAIEVSSALSSFSKTEAARRKSQIRRIEKATAREIVLRKES